MGSVRFFARFILFSIASIPGARATAQLGAEQAVLRPSGVPEWAVVGYGTAFALEGDTLMIGAKYWSPNPGPVPQAEPGAVYAYRRTGTLWTETQLILDPAAGELDLFGDPIALSGDSLLVGVPSRKLNGNESVGVVCAFERQAEQWNFVQTLAAQEAYAEYGGFGGILDLDGTRAAIGSCANLQAEDTTGVVYVYDWDGASWNESARLFTQDFAATEGCFGGGGVSIAGDILAIGSVNPAGGTDRRVLYVFELLNGTWTQTIRLDHPDELQRPHVVGQSIIASTRYGDGLAHYRKSNGSWTLETTFYDSLSSTSVSPAWFRQGRFVRRELVGATAYATVYDPRDSSWTLRGAHLKPDLLNVGGFLGAEMMLSETDLVISATTVIGPLPSEEVWVLSLDPITAYPYCVDSSPTCPLVIYGIGFASPTNAAPFQIDVPATTNNVLGQLFYGFEQAQLPFAGGTLCVTPPLQRTSVQATGGTPPPAVDCSGRLSFDFNELFDAAGQTPLVPGERVNAQYWMRDPSAAQGVALSNALDFLILP